MGIKPRYKGRSGLVGVSRSVTTSPLLPAPRSPASGVDLAQCKRLEKDGASDEEGCWGWLQYCSDKLLR